MQVESTATRSLTRASGIAVGGLLGIAAGSNGALMESPYYVTAMLVLLVSLFGMAAAVVEFRCVELAGAGKG